MSHFTNIKHFEAFLQTEHKAFTYPNMLCMRNTEDIIEKSEGKFDKKAEDHKYVALVNFDEKYDISHIISKEKDDDLKKELKEKHRNIKGNKGRIFFNEVKGMFLKDYEVEISLKDQNPFNFLKSYKEINAFYNKFK